MVKLIHIFLLASLAAGQSWIPDGQPSRGQFKPIMEDVVNGHLIIPRRDLIEPVKKVLVDTFRDKPDTVVYMFFNRTPRSFETRNPSKDEFRIVYDSNGQVLTAIAVFDSLRNDTTYWRKK